MPLLLTPPPMTPIPLTPPLLRLPPLTLLLISLCQSHWGASETMVGKWYNSCAYSDRDGRIRVIVFLIFRYLR